MKAGQRLSTNSQDAERPGFYPVPSHLTLNNQISSHNFATCFYNNNKTGGKLHTHLLTCPKGDSQLDSHSWKKLYKLKIIFSKSLWTMFLLMFQKTSSLLSSFNNMPLVFYHINSFRIPAMFKALCQLHKRGTKMIKMEILLLGNLQSRHAHKQLNESEKVLSGLKNR